LREPGGWEHESNAVEGEKHKTLMNAAEGAPPKSCEIRDGGVLGQEGKL